MYGCVCADSRVHFSVLLKCEITLIKKMGKLVCKIHQILHVKLEKACKYSCHYQLFWVAYIIFYKKLFVTFGRCVHMHHFRMKWFQNIFQHTDKLNWQRCNAWKIFTQIYFWHFRESTMKKLSAMALNYIPLVFNENSPIYQANFRFTNFIQTRLMPMLWKYCQFCWITTAKKELMRKHLNANKIIHISRNFCCPSEKVSIQFSNWRMKTEQKPSKNLLKFTRVKSLMFAVRITLRRKVCTITGNISMDQNPLK